MTLLSSITADEARQITKTANPIELERVRAIEDSFILIRGEAKRGHLVSVQKLVGSRRNFLTSIKNALEENGFSVAVHSEDESTFISISWK